MVKETDNNEENEIVDSEDLDKIDSIYLTFDDGEEVQCEVVGVFEVGEKEYIALLPEDEDEILLYGYQELDEDFELLQIEDEDELERVAGAYFELFEDENDGTEYGEYGEEE